MRCDKEEKEDQSWEESIGCLVKWTGPRRSVYTCQVLEEEWMGCCRLNPVGAKQMEELDSEAHLRGENAC